MRYLIVIAIVVLLDCSLAESRVFTRDLKSDLIARGNRLLQNADAEIKKAKAVANTREVDILRKEEAAIQKLLKELEAAPENAIAHLEHDLRTAEDRLNFELFKLRNPNDQKAILLQRATSLAKLAEDAITKLKAANNDVKVQILQSEEATLKNLVKELEDTKTDAAFAHVEFALFVIELRLNELIKSANTPDPSAVPLKERLLKRVKVLENEAETLLKKLKAEPLKRDSYIAIIERDEALVKKLVADLEAAKPGTDLTQIEQQLRVAENQLISIIWKINTDDTAKTKEELLSTAEALVMKAEDTIEKLEKEHKTAEIDIIKKEQADIQKLVKELNSVADFARITHIEHDLTIADARLAFELHKLEQPTPQLNQNEILLTRATALEKQAETLLAKLKIEKRDADVAILVKEETAVKKLVQDLRAAKTQAEIILLEHELQSAEYKLSYELRKMLDHDFKEDSQKKALLERAEQFEKYALTAIQKLKEDKKDAEVATLEKEESVIKNLIKKLETAKTEVEIHKIETDLRVAEEKLFSDLKVIITKIQTDDNAHKQQLIQKATVIEKQAEEAISKLKATKKDVDAAIIEKDEALIKSLIIDLQAAKTDADVKKIEQELETAETRLAVEIKRVTS